MPCFINLRLRAGRVNPPVRAYRHRTPHEVTLTANQIGRTWVMRGSHTAPHQCLTSNTSPKATSVNWLIPQ